MYSSESLPASASASRRTPSSSRAVAGSVAAPVSFGSASRAALTSARTASGRTPSLRSTGSTTPSACSSRVASRCSGVVSELRRLAASEVAAAKASWDLIVKRSACMVSGVEKS